MKTKTKRKSVGAAKKRILLVDDEPQVLEIFSELLRAVGYEVVSAENALAAMASVVKAAPDLILADIRMPIVGGMDLVREFKSHLDSQGIPIVAFTGYDSPEMRAAALKAGYDDYVPKPLDPGPFLDHVRELLRKFEPAPAAKTGRRKAGKARTRK